MIQRLLSLDYTQSVPRLIGRHGVSPLNLLPFFSSDGRIKIKLKFTMKTHINFVTHFGIRWSAALSPDHPGPLAAF